MMRSVSVQALGGSYPVYVGEKLLLERFRTVVESTGPSSVLVVSHPRLATMHGTGLVDAARASGVPADVLCVPAGERSKSLGAACGLVRRMLALAPDRRALIVALGGGVIGDLAGFAAAVLLRGVRVVQLPTTLLAQVDASVGGKTGVDTPEGKNLVGAFKRPSAVIADVGVLRTLGLRDLRSGWAEVVKHGAIASADYLRRCEELWPVVRRRDCSALEEVVHGSVVIKSRVVSEDEREGGMRAVLNFGHTVAHALETATAYRRYRHGEAVSIGMVSACLVGERLGLTPVGVRARIISAVESAGLPSGLPADLDHGALLRLMHGDKKCEMGSLRFVLLRDVGDPVHSVPVDDSLVLDALRDHAALQESCGYAANA